MKLDGDERNRSSLNVKLETKLLRSGRSRVTGTALSLPSNHTAVVGSF